MSTLPSALLPLIVEFQPLFSKSVWKNAQTLLVGAILAIGKRTVTTCLRVIGKSDDKHFQNYHRVLNRDQWSATTASRLLLRLLVSTFAPTGELVFGLDDTIERRRGEKIKAKSIYRNPVRSSHSHFVKASGLRWLGCMLLNCVPWAEAVWGLPFLTVLCPSERYYAEKGRQHQKLTERAWQMIALIARCLPDRVLVIVTGSSFKVENWYGGGERQVEVYSETCLWGTSGKPYVPFAGCWCAMSRVNLSLGPSCRPSWPTSRSRF